MTPSTSPQAATDQHQSDAVAVNDASTRELYAKRQQIYPKRAKGKFRLIKWVFMAFALAAYYLLPFIRWDRGPDASNQAVLVDFAHQRFYFFFIELWPQELYFVTGLLIIAALALFLATALFGRVWCGYACPQTVWTDLFIAVERFFEGDRNKRMMRDKAPWSFDKAWRKISKHIVWIFIAMATGGAWILYFHDAFDVVHNFFTGQAALTSYIFFAMLTFTTYTLAGTMREQVCTYMCPWPRIQAAMTDREALNVTYRVDRGEPRGPHKKGESWDDRGDCIDCKQCVAVCPMGIDIRNGSQLECIHCALCIDACDDIMDKVGRPRGLITYETDDNVDRFQRGEKPRYRFIRSRTVFYASVLTVICAIMAYGLMTRTTLELNASRDRNPNYVRLSDGSVRNGYTLKVINKSARYVNLDIHVEGDPAIEMRIIGHEGEGLSLPVEPDRTRNFKVFLALPPEAIDGPSESFTFVVSDPETGETATTRSVLLTGAPR